MHPGAGMYPGPDGSQHTTVDAGFGEGLPDGDDRG